MKRKTIYIVLIVIMVMVIFLLCYKGIMKSSESGELNNNNRRNDFLEGMADVSYVKVDGHNVDKDLNTKLVELLNKIDSSSIDSESYSDESEQATGEEAYVFKFYSKDDNLLYLLQYYSSNDKIIILTYSGKKVYYHTINDKDVLEYIKSVIE